MTSRAKDGDHLMRTKNCFFETDTSVTSVVATAEVLRGGLHPWFSFDGFLVGVKL